MARQLRSLLAAGKRRLWRLDVWNCLKKGRRQELLEASHSKLHRPRPGKLICRSSFYWDRVTTAQGFLLLSFWFLRKSSFRLWQHKSKNQCLIPLQTCIYLPLEPPPNPTPLHTHKSLEKRLEQLEFRGRIEIIRTRAFLWSARIEEFWRSEETCSYLNFSERRTVISGFKK